MAKGTLFYRRYQNKNGKSSANGKWYGKVVISRTMTIDDLAAKMQDNCTVKKSDILAVLYELGPTMSEALKDGARVVLPQIGAFKMGISTEGVTRRDDFNLALHLKNAHINYSPVSYKTSSGTRSKEWCEGINFVELPAYVGAKPQTDAPVGS